MSAFNFDWYHSHAFGFVKSTNAIPACYIRVGRQNKSHDRRSKEYRTYPCIPLPNGSIFFLDKVPAEDILIEDTALLGNIRVNPHANLPATLLEPPELSLGIGKVVPVKLVITPLEAFHPEAVKVEDANWDIAFFHPVKEAIDSLLIVLGGE